MNSISSPVFNFQNTNPNLQDAFEVLKRDILLSMNCHALGQVQSFNPTKRSITATINYQKSIVKQAADGTFNTQQVSYPTLVDVPIIVLSGGGSAMTFPVQIGDFCLIFFNDRDMDNWVFSGQIASPNTPRLHSFSDGIALIGLLPFAQALVQIPSYDASNVNVRLASTAKFKVSNSLYTLNGLLQDLLTQLEDLTTQLSTLTVTGVTSGVAVSGVPANAAAITEIGGNISTIATELGSLLA